MKTINMIALSGLFLLLQLPYMLWAQVPQSINYQGIARNSSGVALVNQTIGLRMGFHAGGPTGPVEYQETHTVITGPSGLFSLQMGTGTPSSGLFTDISWESGAIFLEVEMDITGGTSYTTMGTSKMVSVPYSLLAEDAVNALDSIEASPRFDGNGTAASPLELAQQGAAVGEVLKWNGSAWMPAADFTCNEWISDAHGIHNASGNVGIGDTSVPDIKLWVKDSTNNQMDGIGALKYHADDSSYAIWGAHLGKGTGIGAAHYGTYGHALVSHTDDQTGLNTAASAKFYNFSRGPGLLVQCTDPRSNAAGLLVQNGTLNYAIHSQQFTNSAGAAFFQSMGAASIIPAIKVEHTGLGGAAFFTTAPTCTQTAVLISQNGGTGKSLEVALGNAANASNALNVVNEGKGKGIALQNLNVLSLQPAFSINNVGMAGAINVTHNNAAGTAVNVHAVSAANAVPAMRVQNSGTNDAGYFLITNASNAEVAVHGETNGTGSAGFFQVINPSYTGSALEATSNGLFASRTANFVHSGAGTAVYGSKPAGTTAGRVGHFQNFSSSNASDAVLIQTNTVSGAYYALHTNNTGGGKGILISGSGDVGGNFSVSGMVSKGGGSFKIDHPLDPENKYLYHSFVESPDMMNLYNGIAVLDANGRAIVRLPDWFEQLNSDFRYQLTCIGGHAQVYVASKVKGNQFEIAGGTAGLEVSWEVTGIRKDPFALQNRIQVEVEKPAAEKGLYLHPEAYGQSQEKGLMYQLQQQHGAPEQEQ